MFVEWQFRTDPNSVYALQGWRAAFRASMTGSAFSIWILHGRSDRPSAPAVNSDNLRIIGPLFFVYKEWPWRERRLSLLGKDGIPQAVSSLASPRRLHYPRWTHGQPDQSTNTIAVLRTCEQPGDAGLRHLLHDYQGLYRQLAS